MVRPKNRPGPALPYHSSTCYDNTDLPDNLPDNLPDEASPWGETGSASGVKWTTAVYEMTHLYAVSPDDV